MLFHFHLYVTFLFALTCCEEYNLAMKDYLWANSMINTVRNYELKAWHRWKIKEAAAAAAANQRFAPFIIGGDFFGPDYKIPADAPYIGIGRIYRALERPGM